MSLPEGTAPYLALYLVTLVVHVVLVGYVLLGAGWLAITGLLGRRDGRIAATFRDWLPFAVGAAITAGVAPLLFVQLLYQERFYTANLLLSHRWMAVIPALIVGFYAVYLAKSARAAAWSPRLRAAASSVAALCFVFVALSWTENHLLTLRPERWADMYGAGVMHHADVQLAPRLLLWLSAAVPIGATVMAWQVADDRAALARLGWAVVPALFGVMVGAAWMFGTFTAAQGDAVTGGLGTATLAICVVAWAGLGLCWAVLPRFAGRRALMVIPSTLLLIGLGLGAVLRERLRLHALEPIRERVGDAGGMALFLGFFVVNALAIAWCIRTARRHLIK